MNCQTQVRERSSFCYSSEGTSPYLSSEGAILFCPSEGAQAIEESTDGYQSEVAKELETKLKIIKISA